jgi:hypothetical protein
LSLASTSPTKSEKEVMVWIGKGPFDSYGYQKNAFVKGEAEGILPTFVYQVQNRDPPQSQTQFWVVPVDESGNQIGPIAFKTYGRDMYGYWERWHLSETAIIGDFWSGTPPP